MTVFSCSNVDAMEAIRSPQPGDSAEMAGYTSIEDGGGGTFFFDGTHITGAVPTSVRITGASFDPTAPGPIVITAPGHHFADGQAVLIEGVTGNTAALGRWMIAVDKHTPDALTLIGSQGNHPYAGGGTAASVTVTTFGHHCLAPGGRAKVDGVNGKDEFVLDGKYLPVGVTAPDTFSLPAAPIGSYTGGGSVGDRGLSFPCTRPSHTSGRWVRRRDTPDISVAWFGAVGNGVVDDTEPLLATLRATRTVTGTVRLPGGTFLTTAEIALENNVGPASDQGLSISGAGGSGQALRNGTQIRAGGAGMRSVLSIGTGWVTVQGISFHGSGVADHGIHLQGAARLHLDDVLVSETVKDGYRTAGPDAGHPIANNDNIYGREVWALRCGTMYCSPTLASRYPSLRSVKTVNGSVSGQPGSVTLKGTGTDFTSIPARPGDFIVIGAAGADDATLERLEIVSIDGPAQITVQGNHPPARTISNEPFAIGVGDGWVDALTGAGADLGIQPDCSRTLLDTGHFTSCAGSGVVSRSRYGPLLVNQEFNGCGFAGIVIGTLKPADGLGLNTIISHPYFEGTPFFGGCIFIAVARGTTIDQPMWLGHPAHSRLVLNEVQDRNSGIIGCFTDWLMPDGTVGGLQPVGSTTASGIPALRGENLTNFGTFTMPSSGAAVIIDRSPWIKTINVGGRNLNFVEDRGAIDSAADITATPTFPPGADGQEIAVCNVSVHPLTFHDSRATPGGALGTGLVLDCEPGGSVSVPGGRILTLYFSLANSMSGRWTQRGAVSAAVPVISSARPGTVRAAGGDTVTVTGKNLDDAVRVYIGSVTNLVGTITTKSFASLTFTMPPVPAGTYNVLIQTGSGASNVVPVVVVG